MFECSKAQFIGISVSLCPPVFPASIPISSSLFWDPICPNPDSRKATMKPKSTLRHALLFVAVVFALLAMIAPATAQSTDATLSGLAPSAGTLDPVFASGTTSYTASVPYATTDITVTPTATDPNASITVNTVPVTSGSPSGAISLSVGANPISIVVTAEDAITTETYTLTVTRETPNVDLSGLVPSAGTLIPAFASGTISYTAAVPSAATDITVTPTAVNPSATITVNGNPVTSGNPSDPIPLSAGSNTITTVVTGEDAVTTKTYTLTVTRGPKTLFSSGAKTWNTTTANWGLVTGGPYNTAIWSNSDNGDSATLQGTAGTVTLGEAISIRNLTINTASYIITGNTLNFTSGNINITAGGASKAAATTIRSATAGSPTMTDGGVNPQHTILNPTSGNMVLGAVTRAVDKHLYLQGSSTSTNSIASIAKGHANAKLYVESGNWTFGGNVYAGEFSMTGGSLVLNGTLSNDYRSINFSGGTLHWNNQAAIRDNATNDLASDRDFSISGGSIDNTSGAAITTSTTNPQIRWKGNWEFIGSNGANSNLNMGTGLVYLTGNRQVTVTNAATTLTVGGVISNDGTSGRGIIKAGAGTLSLSGSNANTYNGTTTINGGILALNKTAGVNAIAGAITLGDGATTAGNDILRLDANNQIADTAVITFNAATGSNAGIFRLNNRSETVAGIASTGGGGIIENESGSAATSTLTVNNSATQAFSGIIRDGDGTGTDGTLALTKSGGGSLTLSGANSYSGATSVTAGTLKMGANNVIPDASNVSLGTATLDADTFVDTAGTLDVTGADSVINLGAGAAIAFANSSAVTAGVWAGTLDITGTFVPGNDVDPGLGVNPGSIRFGTNNTGLTAAQLAAIKVNGSGAGTYTLDAFGYLKPSGGGPGPVNSFEISAISSPQTVGMPIAGITITAKDASNATAIGFTGTVTFGGTGGFTGTSGSFTAGVLTGVSVTPTVAGSNLTFTVDDDTGPSVGSITITTIQTQYQAWAGGALFNDDANGDGVDNGLAFLLGAGGPNDNAVGLLPTVTESGGDLVMEFDMRNAASRGTATLSIEHSSNLDLGDPWETTLVPDVDNTLNDIVFDISGTGPLGVHATIPASKAADGKLFGRLKANQP